MRSASEPLEQEDEGLVALAGRAAEADLAGAVAGEVGVEAPAGQLGGLRGGRGGGQLRVAEAAVAGEAAAGGGGGDVDVLGERAGEPAQARREAELARRAGRVDGGGTDPARGSPARAAGGRAPRRPSRGSSAPPAARRSPRRARRRPARRSRACRRRRRSQPAARPRSLQRHSRPTSSFAFCRCAAANPFDPQGSPQHDPATSSGIQTGAPARAETSTIASAKLRRRADFPPMSWVFGPSAAGPKMRLVQLGR